MNHNDLKHVFFSAIHLPVDDMARPDYLSLGRLRAIDHFEAVDALTKFRIQSIEKLKKVVFGKVSHAIYKALCQRSYHTFDDFQLQSQHANPTRFDTRKVAINPGDSLARSRGTEDEYLDLLGKSDPALFGFLNEDFSAGFSLKYLFKHGICVGQPGSGKSELLVNLNDQLYRYSSTEPSPFWGGNHCTQIVIDPHSDFATQFARLNHFAKRDDLIYINPAAHPDYRVSINPFEQTDLDPKAVTQKVEGLIVAFQSVFSETSAFSDNMITMLEFCTEVLLLKPNTDIHDLLRFMNDEENHDLVKFGQTQISNRVTRTYFKSQFLKKTTALTKSGVANKLYRLLGSQTFQDFFAKGSCNADKQVKSLDLQALMDSKKVVVIDLCFGEIGEETGKAIGSFLFGLFYAEALRRSSLPDHLRIPCFMTIDEYQNFIANSAKSFEKILTQARKYKLCLLLAQQFISQNSSADFVNNLKSGTGVKISGYSEDSEKNAQLVKVSPADLSKLRVGQFYIKAAENPSIKLQTSARLVIPSPPADALTEAVDFRTLNSYYMSNSEWDRVLKRQLSAYYIRQKLTEPSSDKIQADPKDSTTGQQKERKKRKGKRTLPNNIQF